VASKRRKPAGQRRSIKPKGGRGPHAQSGPPGTVPELVLDRLLRRRAVGALAGDIAPVGGAGGGDGVAHHGGEGRGPTWYKAAAGRKGTAGCLPVNAGRGRSKAGAPARNGHGRKGAPAGTEPSQGGNRASSAGIPSAGGELGDRGRIPEQRGAAEAEGRERPPKRPGQRVAHRRSPERQRVSWRGPAAPERLGKCQERPEGEGRGRIGAAVGASEEQAEFDRAILAATPDSAARPRAESRKEAARGSASDGAIGGRGHTGASSDPDAGGLGKGQARNPDKLVLRALDPAGEDGDGRRAGVLLDPKVLEGEEERRPRAPAGEGAPTPSGA